MENSKLAKSKKLYLLSAVCFLLALIIQLVQDKASIMTIFYVGMCIFMFINVYSTHKKMKKF